MTLHSTSRHPYRLLAAYLLLLVLGGIMGACKQDDNIVAPTEESKTQSYKIAVVLPIGVDGEYKGRLDSTVNWALDNFRSAQKRATTEGDTSKVDLELEWYNEDKEDIKSLASKLATRDDILLTVGPLRDKNVDIMASAFIKTGKPLIAPYATSESVIRKYAVGTAGVNNKKPFLWSLCETDVSMCDVLLANAAEAGAKKVSLLSCVDDYEQTYINWIPFLANEMGMELVSSLQYYDDNLQQMAQLALSDNTDCVICAVKTAEEAEQILKVKKQLGGSAPNVLFTDGAFSTALLAMGDVAEGAEGVAPYADPSTGFLTAYEEQFGLQPVGAEPQVYDAILLAGMTAFVKNHSGSKTDPNEIIRQITSTGDVAQQVWKEADLSALLTLLKKETYVEMVGASGLLRFDSEAYTTLLQSTYVHWKVSGKDITPVGYKTSDESKRINSTLASWNWQTKNVQTLVDQDVNINYKPLTDQWAVLVQGSVGWYNYRHHADVLNMYQMLKSKGWDDDHIILIMADDIAKNPANKWPGEVRASSDGENLYHDLKVDYNTDTLTVTDINDIFLGKRSSHLPVVLPSTAGSNVLVFWSGHGCRTGLTDSSNGFKWGENKGVFSDTMFKQMLTTMNSEGRYRKMLLLLEPCFSANMAVTTEGLPGILAIASSAYNEQSFADYHSTELSNWLSDRFTNNIVKLMKSNTKQTYKDIYVYLTEHTLGSHVNVANASYFGNLYTNTPAEFFDP